MNNKLFDAVKDFVKHAVIDDKLGQLLREKQSESRTVLEWHYWNNLEQKFQKIVELLNV